ncbi:hypothetical protein LC55x_0591 [Lysobacter capsici]|uniref:Uncharacterized protein n=1 Tax=Lysobacter capsici AZ78 TaxID=1444315 RepID=A0A125MMZ0_9GAMM|nr:hypothetical protein LC55x_0591 [Lysobacter capsici]KWS04912.1 hypothetical protein AZ78_2462 [Lysobacter capsici AZ78]
MKVASRLAESASGFSGGGAGGGSSAFDRTHASAIRPPSPGRPRAQTDPPTDPFGPKAARGL